VKLIYTERFRRAYAEALPHIQWACDRRLAFLLRDLRHPSLRAKKYDEAQGIWQARVDGGWLPPEWMFADEGYARFNWMISPFGFSAAVRHAIMLLSFA